MTQLGTRWMNWDDWASICSMSLPLLSHEGVATCVKSWNELIGSVTKKLKSQGAKVDSEGSVQP